MNAIPPYSSTRDLKSSTTCFQTTRDKKKPDNKGQLMLVQLPKQFGCVNLRPTGRKLAAAIRGPVSILKTQQYERNTFREPEVGKKLTLCVCRRNCCSVTQS